MEGFSAPYSPGGQSSIVQPPPWHYAGWILSIEYELAKPPDGFLPAGFGRPTGRASVHIADWQATTDGHELLDPVCSQYKELFVLVEGERDDGLVSFCPFIYVDQDVSMVRGWLQGLPKKFGSVWLTRSVPLEHPAAAPIRSGTRLGASLAVKDRRLIEATMTLTGAEGSRIGFLRQPTYGLLGLPSLVGGATAATPRLVRMAADEVVYGTQHDADATLSFLGHAREDVAALGPVRVLAAAAGYLALTISRVDAAT